MKRLVLLVPNVETAHRIVADLLLAGLDRLPPLPEMPDE